METTAVSVNGVTPPTREASQEERLILAGYEEARRRDALGVQDKWHWKLFAFWLGAYSSLATVVIGGLLLRPITIHAPVQLVQVNDQGKVEPIGPPQDLLVYQPSDAQWMQMVGDWVVKRRWKGVDGPQASEDLNWLYFHTCKPAREDLQRWEKAEKPLEIGKRRVQVELLAVTKTDAPKAFNVLWKEWVTEGTQPAVEQHWAGTLTVGRIKLAHQKAVLHNRLGLCVTTYNWAPQP